jgi:hypothetical protein
MCLQRLARRVVFRIYCISERGGGPSEAKRGWVQSRVCSEKDAESAYPLFSSLVGLELERGRP